jgi:hypothetical protein
MKMRLVACLAVPLGITLGTLEPRAGSEPEITVAELGRLLFWDPILSGAVDGYQHRVQWARARPPAPGKRWGCP